MMDMIERVSRAIELDLWLALDHGALPNPELARDYLMAKGRAAIKAMREPTIGMKLAGAPKITEHMPREGTQADYDAAHDCWQAMIDVALK
jgi:hypothetical protein